ncbi:COP9 signalosome subunit 2 [Nitzschia inconspicua]|uniref:COP9 signalosome subunit 2 n=1 Tax=Nitzschia inconspicua TaxID=303405 RepID=A0A9K3L8E1_9STRA|nr:COP9 signalosome subunit 2 [Nitzschia inconspicua]
MSDEEDYEYEYDDDAMEEDQFEYTDEEEDANDTEVALENAYYNSKGLRESDLQQAADAFEQVIIQEQEELSSSGSKKYGPWSYKSMKQLVKLQLRIGNADEMMKSYNRLLECIAEGDVNPSAVEKGISGMLERVASLLQGGGNAMIRSKNIAGQSDVASSVDLQKLALSIYDATLTLFHPTTGACPNERLWFKTNLKFGQLLYEMNETNKLQQVLRDLKMTQEHDQENNMGDSSSFGSSTQSMEIYALQIQLYSRRKDNKSLRDTFNKAMAVRGGIPHPRTLALIQELGGKMHMQAKEYEAAGKTFFQAFKSYDEAGDPSRLRCLKYLVLASMLHASSINPFDSQEARPYRDDPEIAAMTNLVHAFQNNEIHKFEEILKKNRSRIMEDEFIREHVEDLLRTIRTQVLRRVIRPYTRISLQAISKELNNIPVGDVENLLVGLILDGTLDGRIDQVSGILLKKGERGSGENGNSTSFKHDATDPQLDFVALKFEALSQIAAAIDSMATVSTNPRMKEQASGLRGMIH